MKKVLIGLGVLLVLFILFIWWGSTVETPDVADEVGEDTTTELTNQNFTSDVGNFSIYFEGTPQYTPGTMTTSKGETYPTNLYQYRAADGSVWQALYTEYPKSSDVSNPEGVLLNTVRGTEASIEGKIASTKVGKYQGFPSIDYVINLPEQKYVFKGRNILDGHKLYSVVYIYDEGKEVASENFFNSLKIGK